MNSSDIYNDFGFEIFPRLLPCKLIKNQISPNINVGHCRTRIIILTVPNTVYSRTSMARTLMAHSPWLARTIIMVPTGHSMHIPPWMSGTTFQLTLFFMVPSLFELLKLYCTMFQGHLLGGTRGLYLKRVWCLSLSCDLDHPIIHSRGYTKNLVWIGY